jgi:hypothetical protein
MPTPLAAHLTGSPTADLTALFAADARFASPFADYDNRDHIAYLFRLIPQVLEDAAVVRELQGPDGGRATVLHGRIGEHAADAILEERYAPDGTIAEAMLLLRPLAAVKEAVRRMGELQA